MKPNTLTDDELRAECFAESDVADEVWARLDRLKAGIAQLEADKWRLLKEHGRMETALMMIAGDVKRQGPEMVEIADLGLGRDAYRAAERKRKALKQ